MVGRCGGHVRGRPRARQGADLLQRARQQADPGGPPLGAGDQRRDLGAGTSSCERAVEQSGRLSFGEAQLAQVKLG